MIDGERVTRYSDTPDLQVVEVPFYNLRSRRQGVRTYYVHGARCQLVAERVDPNPFRLDEVDLRIIAAAAEHNVNLVADADQDVEDWPIPRLPSSSGDKP